MIELEFDEKTHTYKYHGKVVPSVTQVIAEWHKVDVYGVPYHVNRYTGAVVASDKMRESAEFGTAVHKVCAAIAQGKAIDSTKLAEIAGDRIASYIDQFNRWANTHKPICEAVECIVISKDRRYAGMIDLVCVIQDKRVIVDIKTGEASLAHIQLAAYAYAYTSQMRLTNTRAGMCCTYLAMITISRHARRHCGAISMYFCQCLTFTVT